MVKVKEQIKITYLVELSNKRSIPINPNELPEVIQGIKSGNPVILKQGIFNPSFFVDIVKDEKRITELMEYNQTIRFQIEQGTAKPKQLEPLSDIFRELRDKLLQSPK